MPNTKVMDKNDPISWPMTNLFTIVNNSPILWFLGWWGGEGGGGGEQGYGGTSNGGGGEGRGRAAYLRWDDLCNFIWMIFPVTGKTAIYLGTSSFFS